MSKKITIPTCMSPFKVTINGEEYTYPSGVEVEVPDEVAHIIECHENALHKPIEEANSGGASSGGGSPEGGGSSSGGKPNVKEKDVNFYDYDGTLLHSYTVEEAQALSELPELPTQKGLICQGWNWSLDDIKAHNRAVDVGATYITDDGKTRLYIEIAAEGRMNVPLCFAQSKANGVTIDWGDGSATETLSGNGNLNTTHTYANIGKYVISLDVADGCTLTLGQNSLSYCVMGGASSNNNAVYRNMLKKVECGKNITRVEGCAFYNCDSLENVVISKDITYVGQYAFSGCRSLQSAVFPKTTVPGTYAFQNCTSLARVVIPKGVSDYLFDGCASLASIVIPNSETTIDNRAFQACVTLASIVIPSGVTSIGSYAFSHCRTLASIVIPSGVTSIGSYAFQACYGMKYYDFSQHESVPTLENTNAFQYIPSDCEIRIPAALVDEWKAATNWSTYADKIVGV